MTVAGASSGASSYSSRSLMIRDRTVGFELSTTTVLTLPRRNTPERRSASVRWSACAASGSGSGGMRRSPRKGHLRDARWDEDHMTFGAKIQNSVVNPMWVDNDRVAGRSLLASHIGRAIRPYPGQENPMALRINSETPTVTAETTQGTINFHDWIGDSWTILFSHPKD